MLEEFMGLPAHPLLLHAAVIFIPLLALLAVAYALVPVIRPHVRWVLGVLALVTPVAALLTKLSGDAFFRRMQERGTVTPDFVPVIQNHQDLGTMTLVVTIVLGLVSLALAYFVAPRAAAMVTTAGGAGTSRTASLVLGALAVLAAAVSLYYVVRTGDSGAKAVWTGQ